MKKIFTLIAALVLIAGCDDGDMGYKTFDFSAQSLNACSENLDESIATETYFKVNGTESLVLILPKGVLQNLPTVDVNDPQIINLSTSNILTYYNYESTPTNGLCEVANIPKVNEKWTGQGKLSVITTPTYKGTKITGYSHDITMVNVTFSNSNGEAITINNSFLGTAKYLYDFTFNFNETEVLGPKVEKCPDSNTFIYTVKSDEILELIVPDLSLTFPQSTNTQTLAVNEVNRLKFIIFDNTISQSRICNPIETQPSTPNPKQTWEATIGTINITTTSVLENYSSEIYLKDVTFRNTTTNETFLLSDIATVDPEKGYLFGKYVH